MTRQVRCAVWSRVVGYLRPVEDWNKSKQREFKDRKTYDVSSLPPLVTAEGGQSVHTRGGEPMTDAEAARSQMVCDG